MIHKDVLDIPFLSYVRMGEHQQDVWEVSDGSCAVLNSDGTTRSFELSNDAECS